MRAQLARTADTQGAEARQARAASGARATVSSSHPVLQLQRLAGNQAVTRLMISGQVVGPRLQPQLRVGPVDDPYEREADRTADQVMRMPEPGAQRTCTQCEEDDRIDEGTIRPAHVVMRSTATVQRAETDAVAPTDAPPIVGEVVSASGRPLDPDVRSFMEPRFGHDFSQVQIHTGSRAAESARAVHAVAYTVGRSVVFDEGAYRPETEAGRRLLAHELTHVIQQGAADTSVLPDAENEFGDSGALHADLSLQPHTTSEWRVQRQTSCCCCATSAAIKNITRIDNAAHMGHSYDLELKMARSTAHGPRVDTECTLEWWEKTNVPYTSGMAANTWTNMFTLVPTSPTFNPWKNRSTACDTNSTVTINDPPALGKQAGRNVTRTLEFNLKVKSGAGCDCADAEKAATATQVLSMVNGAPDWANSSYTTP